MLSFYLSIMESVVSGNIMLNAYQDNAVLVMVINHGYGYKINQISSNLMEILQLKEKVY